MVVAILVVIALILLFGAGVVKGWLANLFGLGCGGLVILAALLWLGSFFGENGFTYIVWTICGILALLAIAAAIFQANEGSERPVISKPYTPVNYDPPAPVASQEVQQRDKVWAWFSEDIALRFSEEDRKKATDLYDADDVIGLDRFCRGVRNRPK